MIKRIIEGIQKADWSEVIWIVIIFVILIITMIVGIIEGIQEASWFLVIFAVFIVVFLIIVVAIAYISVMKLRSQGKCPSCEGRGTTITTKGIENCPDCFGTGKPNGGR